MLLNLAQSSNRLSSNQDASKGRQSLKPVMSRPQIKPTFLVTSLSPNATLADAIRIHWREYLMEAAELSALVIGICFSGSYIYWHASPLAMLSKTADALVMGTLVATVTLVVVWSPFGRRTGAHFNPAVTFTYYCLGFIHRWDAMFYVLFQFLGGMGGVLLAKLILRNRLSMPPVSYVITLPGKHGPAAAFFAVFLFAGTVMLTILFGSNRWRFLKSTPFMVATLTVLFYALSPALSGFSVNPARSFASALFAFLWHGLWIYFLAPCCGMLTAAVLYSHWPGEPRIYCAKVLHDHTSPCPFYCQFIELIPDKERPKK